MQSNTAKETRRESYKKVKNTRNNRQALILSILGDREMTANEITDEMFATGIISRPDPNAVRPRLTELEQAEVVEIVRKEKCPHSNRDVAVYRKYRKTDDG
jgi:DNA-binding PadR family transcriptional regulator